MDRAHVICGVAAVLLLLPGCPGGGRARVEVPASFPEDVPLPAEARLVTAQDLGHRGLNLVFRTRRPPEPVIAEIRGRLEALGWKPLAQADVEEGVFFTCRKEARTVAVGVTRAGEVTTISLAHGLPYLEGQQQ